MDTPSIPNPPAPRAAPPQMLIIAGVAVVGVAVGLRLGMLLARPPAEQASFAPGQAVIRVPTPCPECAEREIQRAQAAERAATIKERIPDPDPRAENAPPVGTPVAPTVVPTTIPPRGPDLSKI